MNNLSEEILIWDIWSGRMFWTKICQSKRLIKESDDNARRLFRMEEVYHLGRHDSFPGSEKNSPQSTTMQKAGSGEAHSRKVIRMHQWMRYAAIIILALMVGAGGGYLYYQADPTRDMITASSTDGK